MHLRSSFALAASLLVTATGAGQELDAFASDVQVRVVNVDVVVSDRQGRPVTDLGREAFELLADGEPVDVRYFSAPGAHPPPAANAAPVPRNGTLDVVVYVDRAFLRPSDAADLGIALRRFLDRQLGARDRVMLLVADRRVEVVHPWTTLRPAIDTLLADELAQPGRGLAIESEYRDLVRSIDRTFEEGTDLDARNPEQHTRALLARINAFADECARDVALTAAQLRQTLAGLAGGPNHTVMLYVGGQLPVRVGATLFEAWDNAFGRNSARWQIRPGSAGAAAGGDGAFEAVQQPSTSVDAGRLFARVAELASAQDVRFYALDTSGLRSSPGTATSRGSRALARASGGSHWELDATQSQASRRAFEELAETTGGRVLAASRDFPALLDAVRHDLDAAYSLGFEPPDGDVETRSIEVRLRRPHRHLEVRYRRAFVHRTTDQEAAQSTVSALLFGAADNPLGVEVEAAMTAHDDGPRRVSLTVKVPLTRLALAAEPRVHAGRISIFVAAGDLERGVAPVRTARVPVRIGHDEVLDVLGRHLEYTFEVEAERGAQAVAVGVRDDLAPLLSTVVLPLVVSEPGPQPAAAGSALPR